MKRGLLSSLSLFFLLAFNVPPSFGLTAEDVQVVTDAQYFQTAMKLIKQAKTSIHVIMFEMAYYEEHPNSPSNLLIRELVSAKKRGVGVEVILEVREEEDRTSQRNRQTGKILANGGVEITYDPSFKTTHAKVLIVDGQLTLLGSTNWTYPALTSNNEVSILLRSKDVAKELTDYFNRVKASGSKH
jgi:phosphatidylserine/phosphatidylglycerophosphate/cardiolipin synthase-like enzyme